MRDGERRNDDSSAKKQNAERDELGREAPMVITPRRMGRLVKQLVSLTRRDAPRQPRED